MKKLLFAIGLFIGLGVFCSCSSDDDNTGLSRKDYEIDFVPITFKIIPTDKDGNNIMHTLSDVKVTAEWRGAIYEKDSSVITTRVYPAHFYGLTSTDTCLVFGELERGIKYENEHITISWADGKNDVIVFSHDPRWIVDKNGNEVPSFIDDVRLNGKSVDYTMKIVK